MNNDAKNTNYNGSHDLISVETELGRMCFKKGEYKAAERAFRKVLAEVEKLNEHGERLSAALLNLATVLSAEGRDNEADPLYQRVLNIDATILGTESSGYAMDLNNVAAHYDTLRRYGEAEQMYRRALAILERQGQTESNGDYALVLNNLAESLWDQERLKEAEPLLRKALTIREDVHGARHPYVAETLINLATLLATSNTNEESDEMFQRAISIFEFALGPNHPEVKAALLDYAEVLNAAGRETEAAALETRVRI